MKEGIIASILLSMVLIVTLLFTGCAGLGYYKTTGGGEFIDEGTGHRITFGFSAQPLGGINSNNLQNARGQFQLIDHDANTNIHGTFDATLPDSYISENGSLFSGTCRVDKGNPVGLRVRFFEDYEESGKDHLGIEIGVLPDPNARQYSGDLLHGNITIHTPSD